MVGRVARLLAPIAIIAVAVAVYLIVHATVDKNNHTMSQSHSAHASGRRHHHKGHHRPKPKVYVVKPGDTLSGIAVTTHIPLTRLETLNPNVSANTLQSGQRLRLRR